VVQEIEHLGLDGDLDPLAPELELLLVELVVTPGETHRAQDSRSEASAGGNVARSHRFCAARSVGDGAELACVHVTDGLLDLGHGVHHEGAVLDDWLVERLAREDDDV